MKIQRSLFTLIVLISIIFVSCSRDPLLVVQGPTMGTWYTVKVAGADSDFDRERIRMAVNAALTRVNHTLNVYDPESEISRFNAFLQPGAFPVTETFMTVARVADVVYERSDGAFDPTVKELVRLWGFGEEGITRRPDPQRIAQELEHVGMEKLRFLENGILKKDSLVQLDFSGIAKGYGVDRVMEEILLLGYENVLVEIGGEVRGKGRWNGKQWIIGIALPDENNIGNQQTMGRLFLNGKACATSGDYQQFYEEEGERYSHLIDPQTGYPIKHDVTSVTVIAENCMLADAVATAAIVLGKEKGLDFIESFEDVEALFIYREHDQLKSAASSGWKW